MIIRIEPSFFYWSITRWVDLTFFKNREAGKAGNDFHEFYSGGSELAKFFPDDEKL